VVLEGGYDLDAVRTSTRAVVRALAGRGAAAVVADADL
jgi:hypothetical protein